MTIEASEQQDTRENGERFNSSVNPAVARILFSLEGKTFLDPNNSIVTPQVAHLMMGRLIHKRPEDLDYGGIEALSEDSRKSFWDKRSRERGPSSFESQNKEWNRNVTEWMEDNVGLDGKNRDQDKDDIVAALGSVGIGFGRWYTSESAVNNKVEAFRQKYLDEKSDVKKFVADIAKGCRTGEAIWENNDSDQPVTIIGDPQEGQDGRYYVSTKEGGFVPVDEVNYPVDLGKLHTRLKAVEGLLGVFGDTDGIPELVEDYASAYGLLSQSMAERTDEGAVLKPYITAAIPDGPEKIRLQALYNKEQKLAQAVSAPHVVYEPKPQQPVEAHEFHPLVADAGGYSEKSDKGPTSPNQDAYFVDAEHGVFGVFDGVGSLKYSEEASGNARDYLQDALAGIDDSLPVDQAVSAVSEVMKDVSKRVAKPGDERYQRLKADLYTFYTTDSIAEEDLRKMYANEKRGIKDIVEQWITWKNGPNSPYIEPIQNNEIRSSYDDQIYYASQGSTTAAAVKLLRGENNQRKAIIAWAGDSRVYLLRGDTLEAMTIDDNPLYEVVGAEEAKRIQDAIASGQKKEDLYKGKTVLLKASNPIHKMVWDEDEWKLQEDYPFDQNGEVEVPLSAIDDYAITKALSDKDLIPNIKVIDIEPGDKFVLTSDGVHEGKKVRRAGMEATLTDPKNAECDDAAKALVALAKGNGVLIDDMTAVVAIVK